MTQARHCVTLRWPLIKSVKAWGPYDHLQYTSLKINMGLNSTNKTVETTQATAFVSDKSCKAFIVAMYACRPTSFRLILYFIS